MTGKQVGWFKQNGVGLMVFGFTAFGSLVVGITAWNAVTADVFTNAEDIVANQSAWLIYVSEQDERTDRLEAEIKKLGDKLDGVGTAVEVIKNDILNQKVGRETTQRDVRAIRNLFDRYLLPPNLAR